MGKEKKTQEKKTHEMLDRWNFQQGERNKKKQIKSTLSDIKIEKNSEKLFYRMIFNN